jgi:hypothetical protein
VRHCGALCALILSQGRPSRTASAEGHDDAAAPPPIADSCFRTGDAVAFQNEALEQQEYAAGHARLHARPLRAASHAQFRANGSSLHFPPLSHGALWCTVALAWVAQDADLQPDPAGASPHDAPRNGADSDEAGGATAPGLVAEVGAVVVELAHSQLPPVKPLDCGDARVCV